MKIFLCPGYKKRLSQQHVVKRIPLGDTVIKQKFFVNLLLSTVLPWKIQIRKSYQYLENRPNLHSSKTSSSACAGNIHVE
jgi:hypothetical protein